MADIRGALMERMRELLTTREFVVVSNREPYVHRVGKRGPVVEKPAGGLVAALDPIMQMASGTWIAWGSGDADFGLADGAGRVGAPPEAPRYTLKRIHLDRRELAGYYYGYSNQALWPLCHMAMDKARFRGRFWRMYQAVNKRFAEAVLAETPADAVVWIHDYHLALCPRYIRLARPDLFLMQFWHIPWPVWDVFRICPQSADLVEGLLANDLIAFQHPRYGQHFLECAERALGARVDGDAGVVEYNGRLSTVETFPISIDFTALDALARSPQCERWITRLRHRFGLRDKYVAIGVDRLDYTKGIPERLKTLELFFRRFPQYHSRLVFIQKCAPSRTQIKAYRELQDRVEQDIARLNATYGSEGWQPVVYLPTSLPPAGMAALYRMADLCIVGSLQDGMNLVAKEFIACQVDQRGVLALSELAGARDELHWVVPINPYDAEGFAGALAQGLEMAAEERRIRMTHLRAYLADHDIYHWLALHFQTAARLLAARGTTRRLVDCIDGIQKRLSERPMALLLDFDGTLAPIAEDPGQARIPARVKTVLERIAQSPGVVMAVLSGRALEDIRRRVGIAGIVYAGNHGLEITGPGWAWAAEEAQQARDIVAACCRRLRLRLRRVPGVVIEEKGLTASVHYRQTPFRRVEEVSRATFEEATRAPAGTLVVRQGKLVWEILPDVSQDKGMAARWIVRRIYGQAWERRIGVVYIGDDRTDEDAFRALADTAITVKVGPGTYPTAAHYSVRNVDEVYEFLQVIAAERRVARVPHEDSGVPTGKQVGLLLRW